MRDISERLTLAGSQRSGEALDRLRRAGMVLIAAGVLSVAGGLFMTEAASGSEGGEPVSLGLIAGQSGGSPPRAPLEAATAVPTATAEPTSTPEPPTSTPEPPTATPRPAATAPAPATRVPLQPTSTPQPAPPASLQALELELYNLHNSARASAGLGGLRLDATLITIAQRRAQDMAAKNYFAHTSPTGETAFSIMAAYGYTYSIAGENIAKNNYPDAQSAGTAMTGFMNSPSHRANIMDARYTNVGVALAIGADGMKYFAVVFAGK